MSNNVSSVGKTASDYAMRATQELARQNSGVVFKDRMTFGDKEQGCCGSIFSKIGAGFSWVWETVKSVFRTIFFCCDYPSSVGGEASLKELTEMKGTLVSLKEKFLSNRTAKTREDFTVWWKEAFDGLSKDAQTRIVKKEFVSWAKSKLRDDNPTDDQINQHAEALYRDKDQIARALDFVRKLTVVSHGSTHFDPVVIVPTYIEVVIDDLSSEISSKESSKE